MRESIEQRDAVVREALTWIGTPYRHMGRVKGAGCDCAMLEAEVYPAALKLPRIDVEFYPPDWNLHRGDERFLSYVESHMGQMGGGEIEGPPKPGDMVLFHFGRAFAHGGIVIAWPQIVHALVGRFVSLDDVDRTRALASREMKFFSPWKTDE